MPLDKPEPLVWVADTHGVFIPQTFARSFNDRNKVVSGVEDSEWAILEAGPDHEEYWQTWQDVQDNATVTLDEISYGIWQDGDVWLIPDGMDWDAEEQKWVWNDDELDAEDEDEADAERDKD